MQNLTLVLKSTIFFFLFMGGFNGLADTQTMDVNNISGFSITEARMLSRSDHTNELSAIYASVKCKGLEVLPELEVYYTVGADQDSSVALQDKLFMVIPMLCLNSEVFTKNQNNNINYQYRAEIPIQKNGLVIEYFIYGKQVSGKAVVFPDEAPMKLNRYKLGSTQNPFASKPLTR